MVFSRNRVRAAALAFPLALGATLLVSPFASAATTDDERALAFDGNATTCSDAGLAGELVDTDGFTYDLSGPEGDQFLHITALPEEVTVTGIVVKGGPGYNVYEPGKRDLETIPWNDLRSPLVGQNDNTPEISHWYACGTTPDDGETSTPPSEPETTTPASSKTSEPPESSTSSQPPASTSPQPTSSSAPATTTAGAATTESSSPAVANASNDGDLATTGFGGGWLLWAGVLFLLAGVATIAGTRALRRV